jgi:phosphate transport system permease protein
MSVNADSTKVERRKLASKPFAKSDRIFFGVARAAAYSSFVIIALILIFLVGRALPALQTQGLMNFAFGSTWNSAATPETFQLGPMLWGSILISIIGVVIAVPLAISIAYFIEFMAPKNLAKAVTTIVDLLAAIPSIVLGLWGAFVFSPIAAGWAKMLNESLGWIPIFDNPEQNFLRSPFIAGIVVAVMIVPIIASITREIFSQMDRDIINASLALGGNRESTFRKVILPTASGGVIGGVLLGLGRALGETVAVLYVLNISFDINWFNILQAKGGSVASMIISKFGEANPSEVSALMAAGLVLFIFTLIINSIASYIVAKAQPWRK